MVEKKCTSSSPEAEDWLRNALRNRPGATLITLASYLWQNGWRGCLTWPQFVHAVASKLYFFRMWADGDYSWERVMGYMRAAVSEATKR